MTGKTINENQDKVIIGMTDDFARVEGRRPRVLVALTESELRSQFNEASSSLADLGFDVDISPRFQTAEGLGRQAVENDVHALLVLSSKSLINELVDVIEKELNARSRNDILLMIKTNTPLNDGATSITIGNTMVFGSKTSATSLAKYILNNYAEEH